ncbi:MAG: VCBS repeat-containing protein [Myxococcales bacterium]|nr:VCBS repeat-containing protein [Myxococcales bacterium]
MRVGGLAALALVLGCNGDEGSCGSDSASGSTSAGTDTSTGGDDLCLGGTLCGEPAACCPAGNECIEGACLPECASEVRCGPKLEICCAEGDVCSGDACVTPGKDCEDSYDCMQGEYCEPVLGKCLIQPDPLTCEIVPDFDALSVALEWSYTADEIISIPVVADINGDDVPEIVVSTTKEQGGSWPNGGIVALNGQTGDVLWKILHDPNNGKWGSHGRASIALGDVNGDGLPDIIYAGRTVGGRSPVHAVDHTGALLWTSHNPDNSQATTTIENGAATLVNLDDDPEAEIIFGAAVFDNDGLMVWSQGGNGGTYGTNSGYTGGISAAVDLDGDSYPEIVSGRNAWKIDWQVVNNAPKVTLTQLWQNNDGGDGYPAIADLDDNGTPEVILVGSSALRVLDGATGKLWCGIDPSGVACQNNDAARTKAIAVRGGGIGGPPTVADFDGDGRPEVGIAGATRYAVYDFNRDGEEIVKPMGDPNPAAGAIFVRWARVTQDASSNTTGSSVFDFQGDGAAEVIYNDECFMRVYSGSDGTIQLELQNSSSTIHEYPLVVDADADGNSEIVVVANTLNCNVPNYTPRKGLYVYGDAGDGWVPTRKVWTSHTYHVTNVSADGNVPFTEVDNWTVPGLNNYRQNVQGEGAFNAPDLTVDLSIGLDLCLDQLTLIATVWNKGSEGVPAGVEVAFYEGPDASGTLLGKIPTAKALLPGGSTKVNLVIPAPADPTDYYVEVDKASEGNGDIPECHEDNNSSKVTAAQCPQPG